MIRSGGKAFNHELPEPAEPYAYHAADPTPGNSFQPQSFNHRLLRLRDDMIFWNKDKGTLVRHVTFETISENWAL